MQRLQSSGHGVVVRPVGIGEGGLPLIVQHGGLGGDGKGGGGILGDKIAVSHRKRRAVGNNAAGGDIHHSAGGIDDLRTASQQKRSGSGNALKGVALLQTDLLPQRGGAGGLAIFRPLTQQGVGGVQRRVHPLVYSNSKGAVEVGEGGQRVIGTAACGSGPNDSGQSGTQTQRQKTLFHLRFSSQRLAIR